jgi:HlyD family secretion protein
MPQPVSVDFAEVDRGPLVVTITDDGRTRIRERYVVSAPLSGRLVRIRHKPGDEVVANDTLLTSIEPTDPALLDPRAIAEAEARVKAAEARLSQAGPRLESAKVALNHEETELGRLQNLAERSAATEKELDAQRVAFRKAGHEYQAAQFEVEIARFELDVARAALTHGQGEEVNSGWSFPVRSPISGRLLRVFQESATIVNAGERILEVGDPGDLEVEVDILSTDAVRVQPGNRVMLEQWGGDESIPGRIRLIEPSAFTKVSALGIEEQRVNVIIDFVDSEDIRPQLGDGYRVEAAIVEWESADVLKVPTGALFRDGDSWAVFVVSEGRAKLTHVTLDHRNDNEAEVIDGLKQGDRVILYPGDRVEQGSRVEARQA